MSEKVSWGNSLKNLVAPFVTFATILFLGSMSMGGTNKEGFYWLLTHGVAGPFVIMQYTDTFSLNNVCLVLAMLAILVARACCSNMATLILSLIVAFFWPIAGWGVAV
jgi:hypothetical protein